MFFFLPLSVDPPRHMTPCPMITHIPLVPRSHPTLLQEPLISHTPPRISNPLVLSLLLHFPPIA